MTHVDTNPSVIHTTDPETSGSELLTVEEMYKKHRSGLVRVAKTNYTRHDPEGTVQEVFIKAHKTFGEHDTFNRGWSSVVLKRTVIDEVRKANRHPEDLASDMHEYADYADPSADADFNKVEYDDSMDRLMGHVARILSTESDSDQWYEVFKLRVIDEAPFSEIAEKQKIDPITARTRFLRARKKLAADPDLRALLGKN